MSGDLLAMSSQNFIEFMDQPQSQYSGKVDIVISFDRSDVGEEGGNHCDVFHY